MSTSILVAGGTPEQRGRIAGVIDSSFDVDVVSAEGPLEALRRLPNAEFGLVLVIEPSPPGEAPALDLVRFLAGHARHGRTPVAWMGEDAAAAGAARALGARVLANPLDESDLKALIRDLLGIG